jgi:hypothetical protein
MGKQSDFTLPLPFLSVFCPPNESVNRYGLSERNCFVVVLGICCLVVVTSDTNHDKRRRGADGYGATRASVRKGDRVALSSDRGEYESVNNERGGFTTREAAMAKERRKGAAERAVVVAQPSSKFTGVTRVKSTGRWRAEFRCGGDGKATFLGSYGTQEEAACAYDRMMV